MLCTPTQHAPIALGAAGTRVIVAQSYARIFFRNSIATGEVRGPAGTSGVRSLSSALTELIPFVVVVVLLRSSTHMSAVSASATSARPVMM